MGSSSIAKGEVKDLPYDIQGELSALRISLDVTVRMIERHGSLTLARNILGYIVDYRGDHESEEALWAAADILGDRHAIEEARNSGRSRVFSQFAVRLRKLIQDLEAAADEDIPY